MEGGSLNTTYVYTSWGNQRYVLPIISVFDYCDLWENILGIDNKE